MKSSVREKVTSSMGTAVEELSVKVTVAAAFARMASTGEPISTDSGRPVTTMEAAVSSGISAISEGTSQAFFMLKWLPSAMRKRLMSSVAETFWLYFSTMSKPSAATLCTSRKAAPARAWSRLRVTVAPCIFSRNSSQFTSPPP